MAIYKKSIQIPVLISLLVSTGIFLTVWLFQDSEDVGRVLNIILLMSLTIFILFIIYAIVAHILLLFKKSIWFFGIPIGILIYFGVLVISLSNFKDLIGEMIGWDVGMIALGIAVIAIGLSLLPRRDPLLPEETLRRLREQSDDLGDTVDAFSQTQSNLEDVMSSVLKESQKFLERLTELMEKSKKKR